jgi:hypothetical protein
MKRMLIGVLLWSGTLAGWAWGQQEAQSPSDYYAGTAAEGAPALLHEVWDGHGGGYGVLGRRPTPPHWGLAYASGYPNGVANHGNPPAAHDYRGPGLGCRACSNGECLYRFYGQPDLFYNYYAWPSCTGLGAELYVAPRPIPPHVGLTYITYQPLMPHEMLYAHHRTYHRYYNGGQGLNRTSVRYWHSVLPWW